MSRRVALITGALRNPLEFISLCHSLFEFRDHGWLDTIVLSTWKGEVENTLGLRRWLASNGVTIFDHQPLRSTLNFDPSISSHIPRQLLLFSQGLELFDDSDVVLKLRTDFCDNLLIHVKRLFDENNYSSDANLSDLFSHNKIGILNANCTRFFDINDILFIGRVEDCRRLIAFDYSNDVHYDSGTISPEMRWFLTFHTSSKDNIFHDALRLLHLNRYEELLHRKPVDQFASLPSVIFRIQLAYFYELHSHYFFIRSGVPAQGLLNTKELFFPSDALHFHPARGLTSTVLTKQGMEQLLASATSHAVPSDLGGLLAGALNGDQIATKNLLAPMNKSEREALDQYSRELKDAGFIRPQSRYHEGAKQPPHGLSRKDLVRAVLTWVPEQYKVPTETISDEVNHNTVSELVWAIAQNVRSQNDSLAKFWWQFACAFCVSDAIDQSSDNLGHEWLPDDIAKNDFRAIRAFGFDWMKDNIEIDFEHIG